MQQLHVGGELEEGKVMEAQGRQCYRIKDKEDGFEGSCLAGRSKRVKMGN